MPDILKKILKEILVLLLIIAASFGIELLVFNYRTFVKFSISKVAKHRKVWKQWKKWLMVSGW